MQVSVGEFGQKRALTLDANILWKIILGEMADTLLRAVSGCLERPVHGNIINIHFIPTRARCRLCGI